MTKYHRNSVAEQKLSNHYGDDFYKSQMDGSYRSASRYVEYLSQIFKPRSVADVGCGRGTWLKAFKENGTEKAVGFDGSWNSQENMIDQSIIFYCADLNKPIPKQKDKYDLAISLEVAEHIEESSAKTFVESLTALADVVMFGAAYTKQGGTNHINEQPHTYWAKIFKEHDYIPYDLFRPVFWGNHDIEFWYQQNTFLYVKIGSQLNIKLANTGYHSIKNIAFMDCVHPRLYNALLSQSTAKALFKNLVLRAIPESMLPLARKLKKLVR